MNFYEAVIKFKKQENPLINKENPLFPDEGEKRDKRWIRDTFEEVNNNLGVRCDMKEALSFFIWEAQKGQANIIFSVETNISSVEEAKNYIKNFFEENYDVCSVEVIKEKEITTGRFHQLGMRGDNNGLIRRYCSDENCMGIDYRNNYQYRIQEEMIPDESISYNQALEMAENLMADNSFMEELKRIYSDENVKKYYGNPVHYKISASNADAASDIAKVLVQALKSNQRLGGSRVNKIYEIREGCYNEDDFRHMFEMAQGNVVFFDMSGSGENHGNYASSYEDVVDYIGGLITKNHIKTLCIFFENTEHPGFANKLIANISEDIDIVEIKEGRGDRETAISYIEKLANSGDYTVTRDEIVKIMPEKTVFTVGEVYEIYNAWFRNGLKNNIYKSYKYCECISLHNVDKKSRPYDELQKMVGLSEIKKIVDEIIDNAHIQKIRSEMGMDSYKTSLHMVFTGNPGSAKTTVARLIAQIFLKEEILDTGKYIECGRADLVGRYVGWTAQTVRSKFREAKGGILFIDEAYSLVDDSNSFGDEAINTIVQEMENHRDDVIVIFAGYPDKMKDFLNKNEGLRSRIAFYLDFPDYNADELTEIIKLMADKKGYKLDKKIESTCHEIFAKACKQKEFGNGRYARNLLEQAMMAQARRITREYNGKKLSRKALVTLKAEDFNVNVVSNMDSDNKHTIGFTV